MKKSTKVLVATVLAAAAAGALAVYIMRRQIHLHRRDLFSPRPFRRLAALGHMGNEPASVDAIRLLRDFVAWEPRRHLRARAQAIIERMTSEVGAPPVEVGGGTA
ncbi:MAG: hypothetical protein FJ207_00070 [Gemmatimonadetes bacterium]|nr:hypothetical protein [Gemmatimonadota bacterium]